MMNFELMRIDDQIVKEYIQLQANLGNLLNHYRVTKRDIYSLLEISPHTLDNKLKNHLFTPGELLKVIEYLNKLP